MRRGSETLSLRKDQRGLAPTLSDIGSHAHQLGTTAKS